MRLDSGLSRSGLAALLGAALLGSACAGEAARPSNRESGVGISLRALHYQIDAPTGWKRADPTPHEADFVLEADRGASWVIVRSTSGSALRLQDIVAFRRTAILSQNDVLEYRETRSYHVHGRHVPVSSARYLMGPQVVLVMTAVDGTLAVEVTAGTPIGSGREREVLEMFQTMRFLDEPAR